MVSLINFKIVNEDLEQRERQEVAARPQETNEQASVQQVFVDVIKQQQPMRGQVLGGLAADSSNKNLNTNSMCKSNQIAQLNQAKHHNLILHPLNNHKQPQPLFNASQQPGNNSIGMPPIDLSANFTVTWRNLKFSIEPKWHQKVMSSGKLNPMRGFGAGAAKSASLSRQQEENNTASQSSQAVTKIVLDKLDGSFRSGELTAILGPSGKYLRVVSFAPA